jgi:arylsulfatase A-like enzyme
LLAACSKTDPAPPASPAPATSAPLAAPSGDAAPSAAAAAAAPSKPRNVLFVTIDSLRADMPWNGYPRAIAPNLAALAEKCTTYSNAYSVSSYTAKSVAAFLSGKYPSTLYRSGFFFANYGVPMSSWPSACTTAVSPPWPGSVTCTFSRAKGLEQGFDEWRTVPGHHLRRADRQPCHQRQDDRARHRAFGQARAQNQAVFRLGALHGPARSVQPPRRSPQLRQQARDKYDQEIFYTDLWVKKLLDFVDQQAFAKDTYLIISADHGEAFGEHGMYKHAFELWDVLTRVPLIVCGPGIKAQRITERRSHIDLVPTFLDLLGQKPAPELSGKSLCRS